MTGRDNVVDLHKARRAANSEALDIGLTQLRLWPEALFELIRIENAGLSSDEFASCAIINEARRLLREN